MGCDIHSFVQIFRNGKWITVDTNPENGERNYSLFGILAGIRGGKAIVEPRGFPKDFETGGSRGFITHQEDWVGDCYFSHLYLTELESRYNRRGFINFKDYQEGKIEYLSFIRQQGQVVCLMESNVKEYEAVEGDIVYVYVDNGEQECMNILMNSLRETKEKYKITDDKEVRYVFGFDC